MELTAVTTPSCQRVSLNTFPWKNAAISVSPWCSPWSRGEQVFLESKQCIKTSQASLGKQPTSPDATTGFPRNDDGCRNSILMTCHFPDLRSASDWSVPRGNFASTDQMSFRRETSACVEMWEWKSEWDFFEIQTLNAAEKFHLPDQNLLAVLHKFVGTWRWVFCLCLVTVPSEPWQFQADVFCQIHSSQLLGYWYLSVLF